MEIARWILTTLYVLVVGMICMYGLHRYWLTFVYYRTRRRVKRAVQRFDDLPAVTVQLPMFNERLVAERVIEAACAIDYPADKLQVQVLDDSTDESAEIARACCDRMRAAGHDVEYRHRTDRVGFKAGALHDGLATARGELIAIFDADFIPPRNILKRTVHHFADAGVGMVQTCWDHLNRESSLLTRSQAIFLDGHFIIEHTARNRAGWWINFNGTAGVWRRDAIDQAGGWQHDTLTEDVDLSYRAQLAGWRFVYLQRVRCPAELPPEMNGFKSQQHRWTKGSIQTAIKLLPRIWRSPAPLMTKVEAWFHLTSPAVYLLMVAMMLLVFPAFYVNASPVERDSVWGWLFGLTLLMIATGSAGTFYLAAQRERKRSMLATIAQVPLLMAIGVGIALNNARAVVEALVGHQSDFVRTPKYSDAGRDRRWRDAVPLVRLPARRITALAEIALAAYLTACAVVAIGSPNTVVSLPFLGLFAAGCWYVGLSSLDLPRPALGRSRRQPTAAVS